MKSVFHSSLVLDLLFRLLFGWRMEGSAGFTPRPSSNTFSKRSSTPCMEESRRFDSGVDDDPLGCDDDGGAEAPPPSFDMDTATMKIDDGGSNLTDRFKYKVHALMGDYDPTGGATDDEDQDGNIMNALITFPTQHVFDVVGKIPLTDSDENTTDDYANRVKTIVFETTGDESIECEIVPRGKKFVKVRCKAMVESTAMINNIYDELGQMESTVMKF